MKSKKKNLTIISILLAFYAVFSAQRALAATEISSDITSPTTWKKENSPYVIKKALQVNAPLTVEAGTVIKFTNIFPLPGYSPSLQLNSSFTSIGSPSDQIIFTSACDSSFGGDTLNYCSPYNRGAPRAGDWGGIYTVADRNSSSISIEYSKIFYGSIGLSYSSIYSDTYKNVSITRSEIAYTDSEGIYVRNTQPHMESLILRNNQIGLYVYEADVRKMPKITNSSIFNNNVGVRGMQAYGYMSIPVDARYNWWGDPSGPYYSYSGGSEAKNLAGIGNRVEGYGVLFRPWDAQDPTIPKESVIFVPGIGASINPDLMISGVFANNWTMFDHTYDGIIAAFKAMGYVEGKNFFIAYYDWRKSNTDSVEKYLKPLIKEAIGKSDATKVNIVTHSMGSLVARSYVQSSDYAGEVDNLIMIAPPNRGSSDIYTAWEGGYIPKNWGSSAMLMRAYINYLRIIGTNLSSYETIHKYIPSLRDLMPTYSYLHNVGDSSNLKDYLSMSEKNEFLLELDSDMQKLNDRTRLSIILGDKKPTVNKIPVVDSDKSGIWQDGKPDPIDPEQNDASGDGEVLISSGEMGSDFRDILEYDHRKIVSKSEKIVAERLNQSLDFIYESPEIKDELVVWTDAPGGMQITDPNSNVVSKDKNEVTDSRYAQEQNKDGFKIASLPNIKKGNYKIDISSSSSGTYHVSAEYVNHEDGSKDVTRTITVETKDGENQVLIIPSDPQDSEDSIEEIVPLDTTPPSIVVTNPVDGKDYFSDKPFKIMFSATDDVSDLQDMEIVAFVDDMDVKNGDTVDLSTLETGAHEFIVSAMDEMGNQTYKDFYFNIIEPPKDIEPPTIQINSPEENKEYESDEKIEIKYSVSDDISLQDKIKIKLYLDEEELDGNKIDLSSVESGEHAVSVLAEDESGKTACEKVTFEVKEKKPSDDSGDEIVGDGGSNDSDGGGNDSDGGSNDSDGRGNDSDGSSNDSDGSGDTQSGGGDDVKGGDISGSEETESPAEQNPVPSTVSNTSTASVVAASSHKKHKHKKKSKSSKITIAQAKSGVTKSNGKIKVLSSSEMKISGYPIEKASLVGVASNTNFSLTNKGNSNSPIVAGVSTQLSKENLINIINSKKKKLYNSLSKILNSSFSFDVAVAPGKIITNNDFVSRNLQIIRAAIILLIFSTFSLALGSIFTFNTLKK